jgi:hypothetical protein
MNARVEKLLDGLTLRVRAFTDPQAMRYLGINDPANWRRFLRPLVDADLVRPVRILSKPVPEMREQLMAHEFGSTSDAIGEAVLRDELRKVLRLARSRWAGVPAVATNCIVATRRCGQMFGVMRTGRLAQPLQATHDLATAGCFESGVMHGVFRAEHWHGEDHADPRIGVRRPDAIVIHPETGTKKVIEVVGAHYDEAKLLAIHQECQSLGLTYALY